MGNGLKVTGLAQDGQAILAGIMVDDVIESCNGVTVKTNFDLAQQMRNAKSVDAVKVKVNRGGQHIVFDLKPGITGVNPAPVVSGGDDIFDVLIPIVFGGAILLITLSTVETVNFFGTHYVFRGSEVPKGLYWGLLMFGGLSVGFGFVKWRKQTATPQGASISNRQQPVPTSNPELSLIEQIEKAKVLYDSGTISEEEFNKIKAKIINP